MSRASNTALLHPYPQERSGDLFWDGRMGKFDSFIEMWSLIDGPLKGAKYTWSNFQENHSLSRLDKFLFCNDWDDWFLRRFQVALSRSTSDHMPILLDSTKEN